MLGAIGSVTAGSLFPPSFTRGTGPVNAAPQQNTLQNASSPSKINTTGELTDAEKAQVEELKKIDREVRAHEQAHKNVGGQYAGSISYEYQVGPDGQRYAVGGEVPIDVSPVEGDPEATVRKMEIVIAAALAPAEPSAQDRAVAAQARNIKNQAQAEIPSQAEELQQADEEETSNIVLDIQEFINGEDVSAQNALIGSNAYQTQGQQQKPDPVITSILSLIG